MEYIPPIAPWPPPITPVDRARPARRAADDRKRRDEEARRRASEDRDGDEGDGEHVDVTA